MGYETKLIVVNKWESSTDSFGETIAILNLCGMPNAFFAEDVFTKDIGDKYLYLDGKEVVEDKYGKKLTYASVEDVLKVLYKCEAEEHYRRTEIAINTLKTFTTTDWAGDKIVVVNYGY